MTKNGSAQGLNKICLHWTGGANFPNNTDLEAYHFCVDKLGKIYQGEFFPEDNLDCKDGRYAKHCGGGNTGCIGISLCGMAGFNLSNLWTKYPLFQAQVEAFCCMAGYLANKYKIKVCEEKVFTHFEFDQRQVLGKREGKIDITHISYLPELAISGVGEYLRGKIGWYKRKIKENRYRLIKKGNCYEFIESI